MGISTQATVTALTPELELAISLIHQSHMRDPEKYVNCSVRLLSPLYASDEGDRYQIIWEFEYREGRHCPFREHFIPIFKEFDIQFVYAVQRCAEYFDSNPSQIYCGKGPSWRKVDIMKMMEEHAPEHISKEIKKPPLL